jgi:hypothetical protein
MKNHMLILANACELVYFIFAERPAAAQHLKSL